MYVSLALILFCLGLDCAADIANYIYDNPDSVPLPLKGFWISDRAYLSSTVNR